MHFGRHLCPETKNPKLGVALFWRPFFASKITSWKQFLRLFLLHLGCILDHFRCQFRKCLLLRSFRRFQKTHSFDLDLPISLEVRRSRPAHTIDDILITFWQPKAPKGGSQNDPKWLPKIDPKWSENQHGKSLENHWNIIRKRGADTSKTKLQCRRSANLHKSANF